MDFCIECVVIPLGDFDLILGVQWLHTLVPILWDFDTQCVSFQARAWLITWTGIAAPSIKVCTVSHTDASLLDTLLTEYEAIFATPSGLPSPRPQDHRIHLLPGSPPVAIHPYRYPQLQKDELERQCAEMLQQGIIRDNTSEFSSPMLLVKKADNTWRFCVDYRALNAHTVKDKFPIPVVDELKGARFFTKLDLRSSCHQVRMHLANIKMTAFCMHCGHFEFLVMPFGLTNAPATFQALMNNLLHRFVLVLCYDILIYSSSWSEHLQHISMVFQVLQQNQLHQTV